GDVFFQAEDGIRGRNVTGVQTCALPICGMKFTDVTAEAGLAGEGYSMGVAAADFDNDGHVDLFVAGVGRSFLYRNLGTGKFEDEIGRASCRERVEGAVDRGRSEQRGGGR